MNTVGDSLVVLRQLAEDVGEIEGGYGGAFEMSLELLYRLDELEQLLDGKQIELMSRTDLLQKIDRKRKEARAKVCTSEEINWLPGEGPND